MGDGLPDFTIGVSTGVVSVLVESISITGLRRGEKKFRVVVSFCEVAAAGRVATFFVVLTVSWEFHRPVDMMVPCFSLKHFAGLVHWLLAGPLVPAGRRCMSHTGHCIAVSRRGLHNG
jgi:hypothetical protein